MDKIVGFGATTDNGTVIFTFDPTHPIDENDFHREGVTSPRNFVIVAGKMIPILSTLDLKYLQENIGKMTIEIAQDVAWLLQHIRRLDKVGQKLESMRRKAAEFRGKLKAKHGVSCDPETDQ